MFEITSRFLESLVLRRMPLSCSYGLVNYADEQSRRDHLEASVRSSQDAMNLADAQNRAGLADLLTVLDAERALFTNQGLLAQSRESARNWTPKRAVLQ